MPYLFIVSVRQLSNMSEDDVTDETYAILAVLVCFLVLVIFLLKLSADQIDYIPSIIRVRQHKPVVAMESVQNPFQLTLNEEHSRTNCIRVTAACSMGVPTQCFSVYTFWGVAIEEFHRYLDHVAQSLATAVRDTGRCCDAASTSSPSQPLALDTLRNISVCTSEPLRIPCGDDATPRCLEPPRHMDAATDLGSERPRTRYPAVCVQHCAGDGDGSPQRSSIVALISVLHIRDAIIAERSRILMQYVVSRNGSLYPLEQLYVESGGGGGDEVVCIICQTESSACCVILPCKHTCVCKRCVQRLDTCPMCRGYIASYFNLGEGESQQVGASADGMANGETPEQPRTLWQRIVRWNDTLNDWIAGTQ